VFQRNRIELKSEDAEGLHKEHKSLRSLVELWWCSAEGGGRRYGAELCLQKVGLDCSCEKTKITEG
jgi:hypothetical protein